MIRAVLSPDIGACEKFHKREIIKKVTPRTGRGSLVQEQGRMEGREARNPRFGHQFSGGLFQEIRRDIGVLDLDLGIGTGVDPPFDEGEFLVGELGLFIGGHVVLVIGGKLGA